MARKRALPWSGSWILYLMVVISLLMARSEGKKGEARREGDGELYTTREREREGESGRGRGRQNDRQAGTQGRSGGMTGMECVAVGRLKIHGVRGGEERV